MMESVLKFLQKHTGLYISIQPCKRATTSSFIPHPSSLICSTRRTNMMWAFFLAAFGAFHGLHSGQSIVRPALFAFRCGHFLFWHCHFNFSSFNRHPRDLRSTRSASSNHTNWSFYLFQAILVLNFLFCKSFLHNSTIAPYLHPPFQPHLRPSSR